MMKKMRYAFEAIFAYLLFGLFRLLPYRVASSLGGFMGRFLGKYMAASRKARKNLATAMPELSETEVRDHILDMWDNLGRIMAEYPHLPKIEDKGVVDIINEEAFQRAVDKGKPIIFVTAHIGNWEVLPFVINARLNAPMALVFRAPNNPWVDRLLRRIRAKGTPEQLAKGPKGAKGIVKIIRDGKNVGMLVDQKMNEGIPIPFFGRNAMTVTSVAQLSLKYDCTVLPVYCERYHGSHFKVNFLDEMVMTSSGQIGKDIEANMRRINEMLEDWIRKIPGQWLWLHRRWPHKKSDHERLEKKLKKTKST